MHLITLTSDFGTSDHYVSSIKGSILKQLQEISFVDISHSIPKFDIIRAAYVLKNAFRDFPDGTIHLISVNPFTQGQATYLALRYANQYFIGPDNGLFSLVFDEDPDEMYVLDNSSPGSFPQKEVFAKAAVYIASGRPFHEIGLPAKRLVQRIGLQPVTGPSHIRGTVIYVDSYENVVVNITKDLFEKIGGDRQFSIYFKRHEPISKLVTFYTQVTVGEPLCLFNHAGYLEIAINMGKAASLLDLQIDDTIQIDFFSK